MRPFTAKYRMRSISLLCVKTKTLEISKMQYHAIIKTGEGEYQHYSNGSLDWYRKNIIVPMFNGQVVVLHEWKGKDDAVVNMRSILEIELFKTSDKIKDDNESERDKFMMSAEFQKHNCTKEILDEVRTSISSNASKSLIQNSLTESKNQIFTIMKFGDIELDSAYEGVIEPIANEFDFEAIRVDKIQDAGKISDQILENIGLSKIVISDLSGERPNCYYETGFAHALGKELILTIRDKEKIHFDLSGYRFIVWKSEADLRKKLRERIQSIVNKNT